MNVSMDKKIQQKTMILFLSFKVDRLLEQKEVR